MATLNYIQTTEYSKSIVDGDHDQVRVAGQDTAVVRRSGVPVEGLAVQEYQDRIPHCLVSCNGCNILHVFLIITIYVVMVMA